MSSCQPPSGHTSGPTAWSMLAARLKQERESRGLSLSGLAEKVRYDRAVLHKMERGLVLGSEYITGRLEELYGTGDTLRTLRTLAKSEARRDKYRTYMELESSACSLHEYAGETVPGILQSEAYAREQIANGSKSQSHVDELVSARMDRKKRLTDGNLIYRAILDEAILVRGMSSRAAWVEQLELLDEMVQLPNVTIQVVPITIGVHDLAGGGVILLWQPDGANAAYAEGSKVGDVVEDPERVASLRLSYDRIRDLSLSPLETRHVLQHLLAEAAQGGEARRPVAPRLLEGAAGAARLLHVRS